MADDSINHFIEEDLIRHEIDFTHCPKHKGHNSPNSYIILNSNSGSRTILHTNLGLPELTSEDFKASMKPLNYSWIHFEGRPDLDEILVMIKTVKGICSERPPNVSLELEKLGGNFDPLLPFVDLIFVSKEYAMFHGFSSKSEVVEAFHSWKRLTHDCTVICPWGDQGASGKSLNGDIIDVPPFAPSNGVIDTIGAGDTFNATVIASFVMGKSLKAALEAACRVAGRKVGQFGFANLKESFY